MAKKSDSLDSAKSGDVPMGGAVRNESLNGKIELQTTKRSASKETLACQEEVEPNMESFDLARGQRMEEEVLAQTHFASDLKMSDLPHLLANGPDSRSTEAFWPKEKIANQAQPHPSQHRFHFPLVEPRVKDPATLTCS